MSKELREPMSKRQWVVGVVTLTAILVVGGFVLHISDLGAYSAPVPCNAQTDYTTDDGLPVIISGAEDTNETGRKVCRIELER
jgi:hypothetical protein